MATTQFSFSAIDGVVSAIDANNSTCETKTPRGDFYGILIYSAALASNDRALVRTWLGNKAALSI